MSTPGLVRAMRLGERCRLDELIAETLTLSGACREDGLSGRGDGRRGVSISITARLDRAVLAAIAAISSG